MWIREEDSACRILVGKPLGRLSRKWDAYIIINCREVGCDDKKWTELAQDNI
jgi:hypothetical protein